MDKQFVNDQNTQAGLYIHIPFCLTKCMYCDFYSVVGQEHQSSRFIKALTSEIEVYGEKYSKLSFKTLFIGGGTPSLLSPDDLEKILKSLEAVFDLSYLTEVTLEANPGEAPLEKLQAFRSLGINRISVGVQSFKQQDLTFLGRIHSSDDVYRTVRSIEKAEFDNFSVDMIYSIPGQSIDDWHSNLEKAVELGTDHISAYNLTVEEKTTLHNLVDTGKVKMSSDSLQASMITFTEQYLCNHGFNQYEISNFSRPGKECLHNLQYWRGHPYISFGPSAASFDGFKRWKNRNSLEFYISRIENGESPVDFSEDLTVTDRINERLGFGIRMNEGVDLSTFNQDAQIIIRKNLNEINDKWQDHLISDGNIIRLTAKGRLFADAIAVDMMI